MYKYHLDHIAMATSVKYMLESTVVSETCMVVLMEIYIFQRAVLT